MRTVRAVATIAVLAVLFGLGTLAPATAAAGPSDQSSGELLPAPPVPRVMLAGDSITQGRDGDFTWRYRLYREFVRQGVGVDLVGPRMFPDGTTHTYLVPKGWDTDHDATAGTRLHAQLSRIGQDMTEAHPDVLVAMYGQNDLAFGGTVDGVIADWRTYIATARSVNPQLKIVLSEIATRNVHHGELNAAVRNLAAELSTGGSPIVVADVDYAGWDLAHDTYDGIHPTPAGETVIAHRVGYALRDLGLLPATPKIWRWDVAWTPILTPGVRSSSTRRVVVSWKKAMTRSSSTAMRVRVTSVRTGKAVTSRWTPRLSLSSKAQPPGRYRVELQAMRGTMVSSWGAPVTVRIARPRR